MNAIATRADTSSVPALYTADNAGIHNVLEAMFPKNIQWIEEYHLRPESGRTVHIFQDLERARNFAAGRGLSIVSVIRIETVLETTEYDPEIALAKRLHAVD